MSEPDVAVKEGLATVGLSEREFCGVRDHARLLTAQLEREGTGCATHWLDLDPLAGLRASRRRVLDFDAALPATLARERTRAVLLHYSVFAFSHRGLPLYVHPTVGALRRAGVPVVAILHEVAFNWPERPEPRAIAWAASQRAAAFDVVRASSALLATADFRAEWLRSRRWLPRRPIRVAPVFSNLPLSAERPAAGHVLGLFGWALAPDARELVLGALAGVRRRLPVELRLLGAPGEESEGAASWRHDAERHRVADALSFSGALPAQELADELARADVLLYADPTGPAGRKGTLAGDLAAGRPLIALEGRRTWRALEESGAVIVVPRAADALAAAVLELFGDAPRREEMGALAAGFYAREMAVERTASAVRELLAEARG
ncbi:MAG TPA: glycosyltransferase [Solirubrobacteraceae bacterium]|nr:glycosyltransferase [Solirubrobacteraceae bacterium]